MNRRSFLTGAATVVAAQAVPKVPLPQAAPVTVPSVLMTSQHAGAWDTITRWLMKFDRLPDGRVRLAIYKSLTKDPEPPGWEFYRFFETHKGGYFEMVAPAEEDPNNPGYPIAMWPWIEEHQIKLYK